MEGGWETGLYRPMEVEDTETVLWIEIAIHQGVLDPLSISHHY
jgi:hypothetical protein